MVRVEIAWRKGSWLARLNGPDDKWRVRRDFEKGTPVKAGGGRLVYDLTPGWYELSEAGSRRYLAVDSLTTHTVPMIADILGMDTISAGPNPGEPGCWQGDRCRCGAEVASYDPDGWPYCEGCEPGIIGVVEEPVQ